MAEERSQQVPPTQAQVMEMSQEKEAPMPSSPSLKYLGFVQVAVIRVIAYVTALYECAKDSSGPLKPGVDSVEGTVKTVVGPVYQKLEDKPLELLTFVDGKVDEIVRLLEGVLPKLVVHKSHDLVDVAKKTPDFVSGIFSDVQKRGVQGTAKGLFDQYLPAVEAGAVNAWKSVRGLPLVPHTVEACKYLGEKANQLIITAKDSQLPLAAYIPLVPVDYIDKLTNVD
ncbi:hypothetical protein R1flu_015718 [Riccia fluitans]|uniref:Small rubber particle protein n=1 Tax=Riccia fluitans TaxID=41844 RepID=A0ABD1YMU5_9MARC